MEKKFFSDLYRSNNVVLDLSMFDGRNCVKGKDMQKMAESIEHIVKTYLNIPNDEEFYLSLTKGAIVDKSVRDQWFDNLLTRQLVSTEEFFHVWDDYKCTCTAGFNNVCEDIWYNAWDEQLRNEFYLKYREVFEV